MGGGGGGSGARSLWPSWKQSCRKVACLGAVAPHEWASGDGHAIVGVLGNSHAAVVASCGTVMPQRGPLGGNDAAKEVFGGTATP